MCRSAYRVKFGPEVNRRYREKNYEKVRERETSWLRDNPEKRKESINRSNAKRRGNSNFRLHDRVGSLVRAHLAKRGKHKSARCSDLFGWTIEELIAHIENLFEDGMSWENMSDWELDHITPYNAVVFTSDRDPTFRKLWSLDNLAPLWMFDNRSKFDRTDWVLPDTYRNPRLRALYENAIDPFEMSLG